MTGLRSATRLWVERTRAVIQATEPRHPDTARALEERWAELPDHVKTPAQMLGRRFLGCEGTHGVFPRCNLACRPCYHSRDANRVRVDPAHTREQVKAQMEYLRARRGTGQHAQLIGGEVTLLGPEAHADTLAVMQAHGRAPMSMSHGDFDYDYLVALTIDATGRRRFDHISFAVHIDSTMLGRRAAPRATSERELHGERQRVIDMFTRLHREFGVRNYVAHNMTVTEANLAEVADVTRACRTMGYRMLSFQPAAAVGARTAGARRFTDDDVWARIEDGAGITLPYRVLEVGDVRCNRTVWGLDAGGRHTPFLEDTSLADREARDLMLHAFSGFTFDGPRGLVALRLGRILTRHPKLLPTALRWAARFVRRAGLTTVVRGPRPVTFVLHNFMDAELTSAAWELLERDLVSSDTAIRAAQERLQACSYHMAHPESDALIPACVQHGVLDLDANRRLAELLPLRPPDGTR